MGSLPELGAIGLAMLAVVMLIDIVRKKYRDAPNGDRRVAPIVVDCPNKIEGLAATLVEVAKQSGMQTKLLTEQLKTIQHSGEGVDRLVDQHKPNIDGRETWKVSPRSERIQEESRDLLKEMVSMMKKNGG